MTQMSLWSLVAALAEPAGRLSTSTTGGFPGCAGSHDLTCTFGPPPSAKTSRPLLVTSRFFTTPRGTPGGGAADAGPLGISTVPMPKAEIAVAANSRLLISTPGVKADRPVAAGSFPEAYHPFRVVVYAEFCAVECNRPSCTSRNHRQTNATMARASAPMETSRSH